jgi:hypothetical protein
MSTRHSLSALAVLAFSLAATMLIVRHAHLLCGVHL